jgi:hypothetical protein
VAELPVLASLGIAEVEVVRKVRVAVFSTGDELQLPGQPLGDGQIYDTNRLAVHLMLNSWAARSLTSALFLTIRRNCVRPLSPPTSRPTWSSAPGRLGGRSRLHQNHS